MPSESKIEKLLNTKQGLKEQKGDVEIPDVITKDLLTEESLEVLTTFGLDAPYLLNKYSCDLEDSLLEVLQKTGRYREHALLLADEVMYLREQLAQYKSKPKATKDLND